MRSLLTERDLFGRDVLTIICQNDLVDLLFHPCVDTLATQVWNGPLQVDSSIIDSFRTLKALKACSSLNKDLCDPLASLQRD